MAKVSVQLAARSYNIYIGPDLIARLGSLLRPLKLTKKAMVVADSNVGPLYGQAVLKALAEAGFTAQLTVIQAGEQAKTLDNANKLYTQAITLELDRHSPIIALGGGVVGDLTGFVAATYLRGVPFIQLPTTLLAQVDSSVGGKVAVNHALGKNLIGAFYQPEFVLIDTAFLSTLPLRELYTGLAEVIKYGLIQDSDFFTYLSKHREEILARQTAAMTEIIRRSCLNKAKVVEQDEREASLRMVLNFGHTIGHAIEASTGYQQYNHGEAVAIGMVGAALISRELGLIESADVEAVRTMLTDFNLPVTAAGLSAEGLIAYLYRDKKVVNGKINWVLLTRIGATTIVNDVPQAVVMKALRAIT